MESNFPQRFVSNLEQAISSTHNQPGAFPAIVQTVAHQASFQLLLEHFFAAAIKAHAWTPKGNIEKIIRACINGQYAEPDMEAEFYSRGGIKAVLALFLATKEHSFVFVEIEKLPRNLFLDLIDQAKEVKFNEKIRPWIETCGRSVSEELPRIKLPRINRHATDGTRRKQNILLCRPNYPGVPSLASNYVHERIAEQAHNYVISVPTNQVFWVPINPVHKKIADQVPLGIEFERSMMDLTEHFPWFDQNVVRQISQTLGAPFIQNAAKSNAMPIIHQSIITMLLFKHCNPSRSVDFLSWKQFQTMIDGGTASDLLFDDDRTPQNPLFVFHWTFEKSVNEINIDHIYQVLSGIAASFGIALRCFPLKTEYLQSRAKVGDSRVLDDIASTNMQYRPVTCYPNENCKLQNEDITMHKRANSCGAEHVEKVVGGDRKQLSCVLEGKRQKHTDIWFHQEFLSTFQEFGEFRVFITTISSPSSLRGLKGEVLHIVHSTWSASRAGVIYSDEPSSKVFARIAPLTRADLCNYSLFVFDCLRLRYDWKESFESLEIGVRLDIAVSPTGSFFVNEITRWWFADFFSSQSLANPKILLCEGFAESMHRYFS